MSPRDRDLRTPKTPPDNVRAQTAVPVAVTREDTLPNGQDPFEVIARRSKSQSMALDDLQPRVRKLEADMADCREGIAGIDAKVDMLVEASTQDREAREERAESARLERREREARQAEREERAAERAAERDKSARDARRAVALAVIAIIVPTITAVGILLAGLR